MMFCYWALLFNSPCLQISIVVIVVVVTTRKAVACELEWVAAQRP